MTFDFPQLRLGVVADDLTGAGDAGAALARHGWPALILVDGVRAVSFREARRWSSIVINTESRHLAPEAAARRTTAACAWLGQAGATRIFKKIDSTLRGHPVREALAGAREAHAARFPFVPAFPRMGRTTVGGIQRVDGRPVADTSAGRDPRSPVRVSHLPMLIRRTAGSDAGRFVVPSDVRTPGDLRRIARAFRRDRYATGSAGFLEALLPYWRGRLRAGGGGTVRRVGEATKVKCQPLPPPVVVCGSASPAARRQVAIYRRRFPCDPVVAAPARRDDSARVMRQVVSEAARLARAIRSPGLLNKSKVKSDPSTGGLILVGGETAWNVAMRLGIRGLAVRAALAVGVAGCEVFMATNGWMGARVVLKPGGFGGDDVLIRARRWIER